MMWPGNSREATIIWRVLDFSDTAQSELLRLDDGDAGAGWLAGQGYSKEGELRVGLTVIADSVLPLRRAKKPREPERQERQVAHAQTAASAAYEDGIHSDVFRGLYA